jgi:hypothetical protein
LSLNAFEERAECGAKREGSGKKENQGVVGGKKREKDGESSVKR